MNAKYFILFKSIIFHDIDYLIDLWNSNWIFNFTPLSYAAFKGQKEIVELLLSQEGIDINCKTILIHNYSRNLNPKPFI